MEQGDIKFINGNLYYYNEVDNKYYLVNMGISAGRNGKRIVYKNAPKNYGVFLDNTTQIIVANGIPQAVGFNTTIESLGIIVGIPISTSPDTFQIPFVGQSTIPFLHVGGQGHSIGAVIDCIPDNDLNDYFVGIVVSYTPIDANSGIMVLLCIQTNVTTVEIYDSWSLKSISKIICQNKGVYNLQFSLQLRSPTAPSQRIIIWLRINGIDVPESATFIDITKENTFYVPAWNFVSSMNAGDYFELMTSCNDTGCEITAFPAQNVKLAGTISTILGNVNVVGIGTTFEKDILVGSFIFSGLNSGTISCNQLSPNVIGVGTLFNSEIIPGTTTIYNSSGQLIGIVQSVIDDVHLTLVLNSFQNIVNQTYVNRNPVGIVQSITDDLHLILQGSGAMQTLIGQDYGNSLVNNPSISSAIVTVTEV